METFRETTLCLAAAHALVKLDDGTVVGDPMEKTTLDTLDWTFGKGEVLFPVFCSSTLSTSPHPPPLPVLLCAQTHVYCVVPS